MKRKEFLLQFLGTLGAIKIEWNEEKTDFISGRVIYDFHDPDEYQDFCWQKTEVDVPSETVLNLAKLINEKRLLSIDKIIINTEELLNLYNKTYDITLSNQEFQVTLEQLESVEVSMIDEGKEVDVFFIHK